MGEVTDAVGIQFRLLNTSRGPAVWSPRAQCDKKQYRRPDARSAGERAESSHHAGRGCGAVASENGEDRDGSVAPRWPELVADAVIVTTGTFLNGLAHVGEQKYSCGRNGEAPSQLLGTSCGRSGLQWTRLKTGTPPRLDGRTIDWSTLRAAARRCGADAVLVSDRADRSAADPMPHRLHDRRNTRCASREHRALASV